jgi:predicted dehydrogenase
MCAAASALAVGIVGVGQIATEAHIPVLLENPHARLSWIVDEDERKAARVARAIRIRPTRLPRDLRELPPADVVLLAVPYGVRTPYYEAFSGRGTAIYAEKPFAASQPEHDRLMSMFEPHLLGCGFQHRSSAIIRRLRDVVASELFGPLLSVRVEFGGPGTRGGKYYSNLRLAGGGLLFEVAVHALDAALFVSRATDVKVLRVHMVREFGFDLHTEAEVEVAREGGGTLSLGILVSSLQFTAMANSYRLRHATLTHAVVQNGEVLWVTPNGGGERYRLDGEFPDYPRTNAQQLSEHWSQYLDAVRSGQANYTNASATALTSSLIGQLYEG